jgi:hypothetical protein
VGGGGTIYTHVSKCKNNKIKGERKKMMEAVRGSDSLKTDKTSRGRLYQI